METGADNVRNQQKQSGINYNTGNISRRLSESQAKQGLQSIQPPLMYAENRVNGYRQTQPQQANIAEPNNIRLNDNRLTDNVITKAQSKLKTGMCQHRDCNNVFEKTVSWKKYCCDECRISEYEKRTGATFKKRKPKGA